jgi:O-antigen ligase
VAQDRSLSLNTLAIFIQAYLICTYIANNANTKSDVTFIVRMLVVSLAIQGAIMVGLRVIGHEVHVSVVEATIFPDGRVGGTIGSPNTAGSYLELMIPLALAVLATQLRRTDKLLAVVAFALGGIGLELTLSRGAWIAVGLALPLFCMLAWHRRLISTWVPVTCAATALLVGVMFQDSLANRVLGDDEGSARSRITLGQMAWEIIGDNPLLGVGTNNCAVAVTHYSTLSQFRGEWPYIIHDKYLLEWVEVGAVGLASFVWFLVCTLRSGWKVWRKHDRLLSPLALGLTAAVAGQMVHMVVEIFNTRPQTQSLWLCAGLIAAMGRVKEGE